jgi:hypothetical protein
VYLNAPPNEPRERDYIYVGSYIAFSLWIGIGVFMLLSRLSLNKVLFYLAVVLSMSIPAWMLYQNFDDHDRSGRTFQMDNARNLLQSCAPNAILFTGGDNDTFPLWYLQEVEDFRTDVRVMVLSYLNTDWYINQLRRSYYKSPAFKLTLTEKDYLQNGPNDALYIQEAIKEGINAKKYLEFIHKQHIGIRAQSVDGETYTILPSRQLVLPGPGADTTTGMRLSVKGNYLPKNELAIIDLLVTNGWERPIYFNFTSYNQLNLNLEPYLMQEGLVYRLSSFRNESEGIEANTQTMYKNLIDNANYENVLNPSIYFNFEDYHARMIEPLRAAFNVLAIGLINEGKEAKAVSVLDHAVQTLYGSHLRPSFSSLQTAEIFLSLGNTTDASMLSTRVFNSTLTEANERIENSKEVSQLSSFLLQHSASLLDRCGDLEYSEKLKAAGLWKE